MSSTPRSLARFFLHRAVVAKKSEIVALNLKDGSVLWSQALPSAPVNWGLAVDRNGRTIVTLEDGQILCFGQRVFASSQN